VSVLKKSGSAGISLVGDALKPTIAAMILLCNAFAASSALAQRAGSPTGGVKALSDQRAVADACDPRLTEDVADLKVPYSKSQDDPDPCCEGQFKEKVSGNAVPFVTLLEYSVGPRVQTLKKRSPWNLAWPATDRDVRIQGRHQELLQRYQIDAAKGPAQVDQAAGPGRFRWNTDRAATLFGEAGDILFAVWITSRGTSGENVERWDSLSASTPVYLPVRIGLADGEREAAVVGGGGRNPAAAPADASSPAEPGPVEYCRINLVANMQLDDVRIEAIRDVAGPPQKPVTVEKSTVLGTRSRVFHLTKFKFRRISPTRAGRGRLRLWARSRSRSTDLAAGCV